MQDILDIDEFDAGNMVIHTGPQEPLPFELPERSQPFCDGVYFCPMPTKYDSDEVWDIDEQGNHYLVGFWDEQKRSYRKGNGPIRSLHVSYLNKVVAPLVKRIENSDKDAVSKDILIGVLTVSRLVGLVIETIDY
jgi:hypothetical protein